MFNFICNLSKNQVNYIFFIIILVVLLNIVIILHKQCSADITKRDKLVDISDYLNITELELFFLAAKENYGNRAVRENIERDYKKYLLSNMEESDLPCYVRAFLRKNLGGSYVR